MKIEGVQGMRTASLYRSRKAGFFHDARKNWDLYLFLVIPLIFLILFQYMPMYGSIMAFQNYSPAKGFLGSPWVGFEHFLRFFNSHQFGKLMWNTASLSIYMIIIGFPFPIMLAIAVNYTKNRFYKKTVQMVTYAPYFISTVVIVALLMQMLDPRYGVVNNLISSLGFQPVYFLGKPEYFRGVYVFSEIWQSVGYHSIIYIAALAGVDRSLHEAAIVDGANYFQRVRYIDIPCIMSTLVIIEILALGNMMSIGFEKAYLMQNSMNSSTSEIIATYIYKTGIFSQAVNYSYPAAIGLFLSVLNLAMIMVVNKLAKYVSDVTLW